VTLLSPVLTHMQYPVDEINAPGIDQEDSERPAISLSKTTFAVTFCLTSDM